MYINPCFIRKNTPELIKKLEKIGLVPMNSDDTTLDNHNYDGKGSHRKIEDGRAIITYSSNHYGIVYDIDSVVKKNRIDCKYNENLFLAIAALRDDSDKNQWFVDKTNSVWWLCGCDTFKEEFNTFNDEPYLNVEDFRKASIDELKNHFI